MKPETYRVARIHTYKDMLCEAIQFLNGDLEEDWLHSLAKKELAALYCELKNKKQ